MKNEEHGRGDLTWLRADGLLYTLAQDGWRRGEPILCNQFMVQVSCDLRYAPVDDADALTGLIHDFLRSSALVAEEQVARENSREANETITTLQAKIQELWDERRQILVDAGSDELALIARCEAAEQALEGMRELNETTEGFLKLRNRQIETTRKAWVAAGEKALAHHPGASNSSHPAYDLWLRIEIAKADPVDVVLSDEAALNPTPQGGKP